MLAIILVVFAVLWRVVPVIMGVNPLNFTPLAASLLFFGARAPRKWLALPVALFIASDVYLNLHAGYRVTPDLIITWGWYVAILFFAGLLREHPRTAHVAGASLVASVSFFLVSNFAVWAVWNMYPKTAAGLGACYVAAIPFFRNTLVSDMVFTLAMFSVPVLAGYLAESRSRQAAA